MSEDRAIRCTRCDDRRWVCEVHPDRPWDGPTACGCGAAGAPCPDCNPSTGIDDPPDLGPGFEIDRDDSK
jgi:hypothetical protein